MISETQFACQNMKFLKEWINKSIVSNLNPALYHRAVLSPVLSMYDCKLLKNTCC